LEKIRPSKFGISAIIEEIRLKSDLQIKPLWPMKKLSTQSEFPNGKISLQPVHMIELLRFGMTI
jgi:hypothetical protein